MTLSLNRSFAEPKRSYGRVVAAEVRSKKAWRHEVVAAVQVDVRGSRSRPLRLAHTRFPLALVGLEVERKVETGRLLRRSVAIRHQEAAAAVDFSTMPSAVSLGAMAVLVAEVATKPRLPAEAE
jgi:hypothetical protein